VFRLIAAMVVVLAVAQAAAGQTYKVPRTPWGDPDLQGTYSNSNEYATPLERPARFEGRKLEEITPAEMAQVRQAAEQQAIDGLAPGPRGPDYWWLENLNLSKRAQPWSVVDPPDGRIPPLTPEARKRGAGPARTSFMGGPFNGPEDLGFLERCITRSIPGSMIPVMYGNNYQIVQTPGFVVITYEIIHEARVIPLDSRPHVASSIRQYLGDARGHWEGDTLVVETTNFTDKTPYRGSSEHLKLVERFTPLGPDTLEWSVTFDDPHTWERPWTFAMNLIHDESQPLFEYACHEGNYGLANILTAARAEEAAAKKK
jgi:hypothetical protein